MADKSQQMEELRRRMAGVEPLEGEPDFFACDETLARFLKARDWHLEEAERLLKETVEYRRRTKPLQADCRWCHERPGYHSMRQVGFDEMGRPVLYSNFAQAATNRNSVEDSVAHVTYLIENAKRTMKPGISTWVFIIDCTGMTLPACNPRLGYGVTQVLANFYPERLGLVICVNHSPVFHGVWKAIRVFLHPNTVAKMKLIRSKRKILQTFSRYFSDELTSWLMEEMKLNKQRPLPQDQLSFWSRGSGKHDPRGSPSYVAQHVEPFLARGPSPASPHRPHPNIADTRQGEVALKALSPEELHEREQAAVAGGGGGGGDESGASEDEGNLLEVEISEEFQIPKDAVPLATCT